MLDGRLRRKNILALNINKTRNMIKELIDSNLPSTVSKYIEGRLKTRSLGRLSHTYIFTIEKCFIGYCILDYDRNIDRGLFIYEIMIDPEKRNLCYGSQLLKEILEYAEQLGFYKVMCKPCPIENTKDREEYRKIHGRLRKWYIRKGFKKFGIEDYVYYIIHPTTASTL